ncbi:uncharacterized protein conserved in bacteria [Hahella chejuensis KCTC 2396]|uniref:Uncharacterized protein conserved in bacteria n=1 Tax=Hahella chejuensis (strain KCTC 2396) TaxID=349521 RepID=Q2SF76_HAHCH|nr:DUF2141 domain-containing protein [Hahella chejuensis]ABC30698.1 uncharacterized protein conserved in bacteria [Hahella chejuensis KCTC 2396]
MRTPTWKQAKPFAQLVAAGCLATLGATIVLAADTPTGSIEVQLQRLENDNGGLMVHLYTSADGFPDTPAKASIKLYVKPTDASAHATFANVPYGVYAVAVCHDANSNDDCDANFLGIPKEGVGVSNNAKGFMGPPSFDKSKFTLQEPSKVVSIDLDY